MTLNFSLSQLAERSNEENILKKTLKLLGITTALMASSALFVSAQAADKIGYINTAEVFQSLPQREAVMKAMQKEFKEKQDELQKIEATLQTKMEKLKRDAQLMTAADTEKLRLEIGQLQSEYQIKGQTLQRSAQEREAQETEKLLKVIQGAVEKVAKQQKYDMIIDARDVLYAQPADNISAQVIKSLK